VPPLAEPPAATLPSPVPSVAVYQMSSGTSGNESAGWLRYLLDQVWHLPYQRVTSSQIAGGALAGVDVLLVPNGVPTVASNALGPAGRRALIDWVNGGGRYVGWRGGADLAARLGITTALLSEPKSDIAGTLIRALVNESSPLPADVGPFDWVFYDYDVVMRASDPSHVALRYPAAASPDFFVSGFARGEEELGGTAAVIDEPVGAGSVILSSTDPNFRAWTVGMQKVLWNAVFGPDAFAGIAPRAGSGVRADKEKAARSAAASIAALESPLRTASAQPALTPSRRCLAATAPRTQCGRPVRRPPSWSPTRAGSPETTTRSRLRSQATSPRRACPCSPSRRPSRASTGRPPTGTAARRLSGATGRRLVTPQAPRSR
jgi:hypothetical protein